MFRNAGTTFGPFVLLILLFQLYWTTISAQPPDSIEETVTAFRGKHSISGTIILANGTPVNGRVRIRLSSLMGGDSIASTDEYGKFFFSRISNGTYTLTVDEDKDHGIGSTTVEVSLPNGAAPQTFMVTLRLSDRRDPSKKPAVISSAAAGVPKSAMTLYNKAVEADRLGNHAGAITLLQKAVLEYPQFLLALNELGVVYMRANELDKADAALIEALKVQPDDFQALLNRGIVLIRLSRMGEAEPLLQSAIKSNAGSFLAYYYLARVLISTKQYQDAEKALQTAISIGGDEIKEAHRSLAKIYIETYRDKEAAAELETYLRLRPDAPDAEQLRRTIEQLLATAPPPPKTKPL